jgi:hypothetical protein
VARRGESKYDAFGDYLRGATGDRLDLTFDEIEGIIGIPLTHSARNYEAAWANTRNGGAVIINQWMDAGWRVRSRHLGEERIVFERVGPPVAATSATAVKPAARHGSADELARVAVRSLMVLDMGSVLATVSEYGYANPVLCAIDAVWSLGVRYEAVRRSVASYVAWVQSQGTDPLSAAHTPMDALRMLDGMSPEAMANEVFRNHQLTSTKSGILKAEAVRRYLAVLANHEISTKDDVERGQSALEPALREVKGQSRGASTEYFFMLCGFEGRVKPDRMIQRFVEEAISTSVSAEAAAALVVDAARILAEWIPGLSPRALDRAIWAYQRERSDE